MSGSRVCAGRDTVHLGAELCNTRSVFSRRGDFGCSACINIQGIANGRRQRVLLLVCHACKHTTHELQASLLVGSRPSRNAVATRVRGRRSSTETWHAHEIELLGDCCCYVQDGWLAGNNVLCTVSFESGGMRASCTECDCLRLSRSPRYPVVNEF
jgi:hypothetical protein